MKRTLVLVALLFAVVLGLVAWWASRHLAELEAENARVASAVAGEERAKSELEPLDARPRAAEPVALGVAPAAEIATVPAPPEAGLELFVVAKDGGAPIAGAIVHAQSFAQLGFSEYARAPAIDADLEERLASAPEYVSDAQGRVVLPRQLRPSSVCARKGDLYGERALGRAEASPMRLELAADRVLLVRVIDGNARPVAGVPVGLHRGAVDAAPEPFWTAATSADGVARIAHVDTLLKQRHEAGAFRVRLEILAREGELGALTLDPAALPTEPVELILPPCGSVDVRYFGPGGETVHAGGVTIADAARLDERGDLPWEAPVYQPSVLEPSHAFYPFVGTGLELYVALLGGGIGQTHKRFQGPTRDGERVTIDLEVEEVLAAITFRVLRPDRRPFASQTLQVSAHGPLGTISSPRTTDAEGRVRAPVPALVSNAAGARLWLSTGDDDGAPLNAFVSLPPKLQCGEHDLGDVVLQRPTLLARVRVVDDMGRGIAGASVKARARGLDGGYSVTVEPREPPDEGWFEVRGGLVGVPMDVFASKSGHANAARIEFTPPAGALVITLPRASTLAGRALVDDDPKGQLKVLIRYRDPLPPEIAAAEGARSTIVGATGEFRMEDVRPGRVDLEFRSTVEPEFRVVLEDVLLLPGELATDGRLETLDLRKSKRVPSSAKPR